MSETEVHEIRTLEDAIRAGFIEWPEIPGLYWRETPDGRKIFLDFAGYTPQRAFMESKPVNAVNTDGKSPA